MELFTAYVLFSLYSQPDAPIFSLFQHFLTSALECILSHTTPADLPSLCSVVAEVHTLIQSVLAVMTAEDAYTTFTACLPQVEPSWREAQRPAIAKALQEWLGGVLGALRTMVDGVIAPLRTVEQLAGVKRRVREVLTAMQAQWAASLRVIFAGETTDPLAALFDETFGAKSQELIRACFEAMCEQMRASVTRLSDVSLVYLNEEVAKRVVSPITQLFVDLSDLEYTQS